MNRRDFLQTASVFCVGLASDGARLFAQPTEPAEWRTFELTTRVEVRNESGATRIWLPAALIAQAPFQRTISNTFTAPGGTATLIRRAEDSLGIVSAEFPAGVKPELSLISRVATRAYSVDLSGRGRGAGPKETRASLEHFLRPTRLLPTDGIVRRRAIEITAGAKTGVDKARAIYEWIVDNTFRDPATRGCGVGDIRFMLESKNLGGKCADLNALYVGLARAAGLPARDVYGIRAGKSQLGYASLGTSSDVITKSQHCRAEVYLASYGWVPVDPADVRKVALEEPPGNRSLADAMVREARTRLFGSWEMNWIAYNYAHDVALPGSSGPAVGFLMYPQAETGGRRLDSLDPDSFHYAITSREITAHAA
jgi:transglutaminase-like putative cysteine protease